MMPALSRVQLHPESKHGPPSYMWMVNEIRACAADDVLYPIQCGSKSSKQKLYVSFMKSILGNYTL